jgi:hypothetical protein
MMGLEAAICPTGGVTGGMMGLEATAKLADAAKMAAKTKPRKLKEVESMRVGSWSTEIFYARQE